MLIIAHRGNIEGPSIDQNKPHHIMIAIYEGFDAEVDVWHTMSGLFTGHDCPEYKIEHSFLINRHLWVHCKNVEAYINLSKDDRINLFYHTEGIAMTSKGYLWTAPGIEVDNNSIAVMPELCENWNITKAFGVCTDYPLRYR